MLEELVDDYNIQKKGTTPSDCAQAGSNLAVIKKLLDDNSKKSIIGKQKDRWCFIEYSETISGINFRYIFYEDDNIVKVVKDFTTPKSKKDLQIGSKIDKNVNRVVWTGTYKSTDPDIPYQALATQYRTADDNKTRAVDPVNSVGAKLAGKKFKNEL